VVALQASLARPCRRNILARPLELYTIGVGLGSRVASAVACGRGAPALRHAKQPDTPAGVCMNLGRLRQGDLSQELTCYGTEAFLQLYILILAKTMLQGSDLELCLKPNIEADLSMLVWARIKQYIALNAIITPILKMPGYGKSDPRLCILHAHRGTLFIGHLSL
jgi:hypothetical protein